MPVVTTEQVFDLPADELWALIGDFGDTGKWSGRPPEGCVQEGEGIGALRTLTLADGRKIVDRLEAQSANSYSYSIVTSPLPWLRPPSASASTSGSPGALSLASCC